MTEAKIADAKRTLWSHQDMMIELVADIRERNAREAVASTLAATPAVPEPVRVMPPGRSGGPHGI